ncbi:MAG: MnmC family methyltransferase [Candidatus Woesearchaeota archaeon]
MELQKQETSDGSVTFYHPGYQETYHSRTGARTEAVKKFVEPLGLGTWNQQNLSVMDFCFGFGYNTAALLDAVFRSSIAMVRIDAYEIDMTPLRMIPTHKAPFSSYPLLGKLCQRWLDGEDPVMVKYDHLMIYLHFKIGDGPTLLRATKQQYDIVLFDPFSPKKQPMLWTQEVFQLLYDHMHPGGILTTYSCAGAVRRAMKHVGFSVLDGPVVGRRAPSTIAKKPKEE